MKMMKSLSVLSLVVFCLAIATVAGAAITQVGTGGDYYGYGYWNGYANSCAGGTSSCAGAQYGMAPYQGSSAEYCMKYVPGCWVPVRITMPGRWEYRRVWIREYPVTLYQRVPGYWQRTMNGVPIPDMSVWRTQNGAWNGTPYQSQQGAYPGGYSGSSPGGYFDQYGVWRSSQ